MLESYCMLESDIHLQLQIMRMKFRQALAISSLVSVGLHPWTGSCCFRWAGWLMAKMGSVTCLL